MVESTQYPVIVVERSPGEASSNTNSRFVEMQTDTYETGGLEYCHLNSAISAYTTYESLFSSISYGGFALARVHFAQLRKKFKSCGVVVGREA